MPSSLKVFGLTSFRVHTTFSFFLLFIGLGVCLVQQSSNFLSYDDYFFIIFFQMVFFSCLICCFPFFLMLFEKWHAVIALLVWQCPVQSSNKPLTKIPCLCVLDLKLCRYLTTVPTRCSFLSLFIVMYFYYYFFQRSLQSKNFIIFLKQFRWIKQFLYLIFSCCCPFA